MGCLSNPPPLLKRHHQPEFAVEVTNTQAQPGKEAGTLAEKTMPVLSATSAAPLRLAKPPGANTEQVTQATDFAG